MIIPIRYTPNAIKTQTIDLLLILDPPKVQFKNYSTILNKKFKLKLFMRYNLCDKMRYNRGYNH